MLHVKNIEEIPQTDTPVVLAMGCFDGVHIGHQKVISTAVEQAQACGGEAWIYTFNPHPAKVLCPDKAPALISAPPCRMGQFEALGVHGVIEIPFDKTIAHIEPEEFLSNLWKNLPTLSGIVCGIDWSFGYKARGKFQTLETFCNAHGMTATAVHPVLFNGERVSSTHVRQAIQAGNIPFAEQLLGRPFCIFGTIVKGRGIGRSLGFPTANIEPENELIPAPGVYAAYTKIQSSGFRVQSSEQKNCEPETGNVELHPSAVFIGTRATFNDHEPAIESYLFDFDQDLYGQQIEVCLIKKIRDIRPFPSKKVLIEQIKKDVEQIRGILAGKN
ncbi:MAG: riboflavin biosynthesis protein RibF [Kiritimatiellales bacterium]